MEYLIAHPYDIHKCLKVIADDISLFPGLTQEDLREQLQTSIPRQEVIIAREGEDILGFILFLRDRRELVYFEVLPEHRGKGIAEELFKFMCRVLAGDDDIKVLTFRPEDKMGTLAVKYYKKLGFVPGKLTYRNNYPCQEYIYKV